jgi:hypothetical protein
MVISLLFGQDGEFDPEIQFAASEDVTASADS